MLRILLGNLGVSCGNSLPMQLANLAMQMATALGEGFAFSWETLEFPPELATDGTSSTCGFPWENSGADESAISWMSQLFRKCATMAMLMNHLYDR